MSIFLYERLYPKKTFLLLTTHPSYSELFIKEKFYMSACCGEPIEYSNTYFLSDALTDVNNMQIALAQQEGLGHGLIIVKKLPNYNYAEIFYFYAALDNKEINNFYLNNLNLLEQFISYFKNAYNHKLEELSKKAIIYPSDSKDIFLLNPNLKNVIIPKDFNLEHKTSNPAISLSNRITAREKSCLHLIKSGCSNKIIARKLNISVRTVEKHIENMKSKLSINSRYKLILENFEAISEI